MIRNHFFKYAKNVECVECTIEKFEIDVHVLPLGCFVSSITLLVKRPFCLLDFVKSCVNHSCFVAFDKISKESGDSFYIK